MKIWILIQSMIASLIFFPSKEYSVLPEDYGLRSETVELVTKDGLKLSGWYFGVENSKGTIYLLHGNAGNISNRLFKAAEWAKRGFSAFLLDYRGYGKSEGTITGEQDLYEDAQAGFRWLREDKKLASSQIILFGESIGAAPVLELATKENFLGLVLEAPFTSLPALAKVHYPFVPGFLMSGFQFDNLEKISKIKTPLFIVHGEDDEICPFAMGKTLFEKASPPKEFWGIPNGHHNDLESAGGAEFYDRPLQFLADQEKLSNQGGIRQ